MRPDALPATAPDLQVMVVDRDEHRGALLVRFLESRGWRAGLMVDPRTVIRRRAKRLSLAAIVLTIRDDDPDAFELLGAIAAHAIDARVVVCARRDLDFRSLPVHRVLPEGCRFSLVAEALEDSKEGRVVPDAAE